MKKIVFIAIGLSCCASFVNAQNEMDAFRYSFTGIGGTARVIGIAGAATALGGDYSCVHYNPAGLGLYKRGDFMLTPSFRFVTATEDYLNESQKEIKSNLSLSNFGLVFAIPVKNSKGAERTSGVLNLNVAIGYNQINNFHRKTFFEGYDTKNSITDFFKQRADGTDYTAFENNDPNYILSYEYWAWYTYMIDTMPGSTMYYYPAVYKGNIQQLQSRIEKGRQNEWNLAGAANIENKIFFGASLNIMDVRYFSSTEYHETDINNQHQVQSDSTTDFESLALKEDLNANGTGISLRIGTLYRPMDWMRIGISFTTPTYISFTDVYTLSMTSSFDDGTEWPQNNIPQSIGTFQYSITTPYRVNVGLTFVNENYGLISADFEVTDYTTAILRPYSTFTNENKKIAEEGTLGYNARVGAEFKIDFLSLRAGYALYKNPLNDETLAGISPYKHVITAGFGFKSKYYYWDFAIINTNYQEQYTPYTLSNQDVPVVNNKTKKIEFYTTLGFRF